MPNTQKLFKVVSTSRRRSEIAPGRASDSEQRFRELALAALEKQQVERAKLARILHDDVAPMLSGAGLQLDILRMDFADSFPRIASCTGEIQDLLDRVVRSIRDLSYRLNPEIVAGAGLQPALDLLVRRFEKIFSGSLRLGYESSARVTPETAVAMERIAEEAVDNAVRHARCDRIEILVKDTRKGVALKVGDNGSGFDYQQQQRAPRGLGLLMMEYWATKAELKLAVKGKGAKGAVITVTAIQKKTSEITRYHAVQPSSRR